MVPPESCRARAPFRHPPAPAVSYLRRPRSRRNEAELLRWVCQKRWSCGLRWGRLRAEARCKAAAVLGVCFGERRHAGREVGCCLRTGPAATPTPTSTSNMFSRTTPQRRETIRIRLRFRYSQSFTNANTNQGVVETDGKAYKRVPLCAPTMVLKGR